MIENFSERRPILRVYAGAMYTGKTFGLIRDLTSLDHTSIRYQAFKPLTDDRYDKITTRFASKKTDEPIVSIDAIPINANNPYELLDHLNPETRVVGIDEVQFFGLHEDEIFDTKLIDVLLHLKNDRNISVVASTLDLNFRGEPFGCAPILLAYADQVSKERMSRCMYEGCTNIGTRTQRFLRNEPAPYSDLLVYTEKTRGNPERTYALRCEEHHVVPGKQKFTRI